MTLDLLAFGAHPDDVELSCGGWLAAAADRGHRTAIVDLSAGECATNGTVEQRAEEAAAAGAILGLSERRNLGLPDTGLRSTDPEQLAAVVAAIRELKPAVVLGPMVRARHPDHAEAASLVERAHFLSAVRNHRPDLGDPHRALRWVRYPQRKEAKPDFVVDVTAVYERKEAAIAAHATQFGAAGAATLLNRPLGVEAFVVRDRYWGATIGVAYGEPYVLGAPVPLSDPLAHFHAHSSPVVLVPAP